MVLSKIECPSCSAQVDEGMLFCPNCFNEFETNSDSNKGDSAAGSGNSQKSGGKIVCSSCNRECDAGMLFCPFCFNEFETPQGVSSQNSSQETPENELDDDIDPSELIDRRYRIIETYKVGTSNSIYKVLDMIDKNAVYSLREFNLSGETAIKSEEMIKTFDEIIETFLKVSHPCIAKIYDYFHSQESLFVVYEYTEGLTLTSFLEHFHSKMGHAVPEGILVLMALKLCDILDYMHNLAKPIYCVDMRPSSIVVSEDVSEFCLLNLGIPYILDALKLYNDNDEDEYQEINPSFKSPERDIWCACALVYFLISGLDLQRFDSLAHNDIKEIRPDLSQALCEVIMKGLGANRLSKFSSVKEFRSALTAKCKPKRLEFYDFYYKFIDFDLNSVDWNMFLANHGRTSAIGRSPNIPLQLLWRFNIPSCTHSSVAPLRESAVISLNDGQIFTVNIKEGNLEWNCQIKDTVNTLAIKDNKIYTSSSSSPYVFCLDHRKQPSGIWKTAIDGMLMTGPVIEGDILYQLSYDASIFAFNAETGSLDWKEELAVKTISSPVVCDGILYFGALNGYIYAFDLTSRSLKWQYNTGGSISLSSSIHDDNLITVSTAGIIYSLDRLSSSINWKLELEDVLTSPVRVSRNMYLCITQKGIMHNISPEGKINWRLKLGAVGDYNYAVTNNRAYVFAPDGRMMAIDIFTGKLVDKMTSREKIISPPVVYDGKLIFVTGNGSLYCFH